MEEKKQPKKYAGFTLTTWAGIAICTFMLHYLTFYVI